MWEKEKLLMSSNFSFSHIVFYPFGELSGAYIKFRNCRLRTLRIWKSLNFFVWERVNELIAIFQLSSAASLNLGQSQNAVLGNGLNPIFAKCVGYRTTASGEVTLRTTQFLEQLRKNPTLKIMRDELVSLLQDQLEKIGIQPVWVISIFIGKFFGRF